MILHVIQVRIIFSFLSSTNTYVIVLYTTFTEHF